MTKAKQTMNRLFFLNIKRVLSQVLCDVVPHASSKESI